ncbi:MAG TPA: hypothetical protein VFJ66_04675, partial [Gaiellales bacterium]|nr:hypothetical protein [Gaiellales bacterium]
MLVADVSVVPGSVTVTVTVVPGSVTVTVVPGSVTVEVGRVISVGATALCGPVPAVEPEGGSTMRTVLPLRRTTTKSLTVDDSRTTRVRPWMTVGIRTVMA